jgi:alpha-tubulin suppressor-like RCC1 family protein
MDRKLWNTSYLRILLIFSCLLMASGRAMPTSASAPRSAESLPKSLGSANLVPTQPTAIETLDFTAIAAGESYTCGLVAGGGVKCWGDNGYGQLGDGTKNPSSTPVDVVGLASGVTAIAAVGYHTCVLVAGGGVKCWGYNGYGQLGDGTTTSSTTPVDVVGLGSPVTAIAVGRYHTCALVAGGSAKCWGMNNWGQLGDGTTTNSSTPVGVAGLASGVIAIAASEFNVCALVTGGGAKCWGNNQYGQLGDGTTVSYSKMPVNVVGLASGVTVIDAGIYHTCALVAGGGAKCWGWNDYGQLGDGTSTSKNTPVVVSGLISGVTGITAGERQTCAVVAGAAKCWGGNAQGQVGNGTTINSNTPVDVAGLASGVTAIAAGGSHTCALVTGGGDKCWGYNGYGQLGDGTTTQRSTPVDVVGLTSGVTTIAAGLYHTCSLASGGGAWCWGDNGNGQLGDGTTTQRSTPVVVAGLASNVTAITAGWNHTCGLIMGGGKCWGDNWYGQLGDSTTTNSNTPVNVTGLASGVTVIAAGGRHTCALVAGGAKCWGANYYGQLGDGTTTWWNTPVGVTGLASGVTAIAAGGGHTCALVSGGGVKCWGHNLYGQLGDGTTTNSSTPVNVVGLTSGVTAIIVGSFHTCALVSGGGVKCWGYNGHGELGDGTSTDSNCPVDVIGLTTSVAAFTGESYHTCALVAGGVKCWGYNLSGELGDGTTVSSNTPVDVSGMASGVTAIAAGGYHTCALVGAGRPKCWGLDNNGQLGIGTIVQRLTPVDVVDSLLPSLTINYLSGQPGSFFTLSGWNFPPGGQGTLSINSQVITSSLPISPSGSFIFFLDSSGAEQGIYQATVRVNPSAVIYFSLANGDPLRAQEGGGLTVIVPPGIAFHSILYLPVVSR